MLSEDLQIYKDTTTFVKKLSDVIQNRITKSWRYLVGVDMFREAMYLYKYIRLANIGTSQDRITNLENYLTSLDTIKAYVRMSIETRNIGLNSSAELILMIDNLGKQASGWRNSSVNPTRSDEIKVSSAESGNVNND